MGQTDVRHWSLLPPSEAPSLQDDDWRHFDKSVNAISFGFVATAILISMFLVMAIFERFLMTTTTTAPPSSGGGRSSAGDVESQMGFNSKHVISSPKAARNAREVSVLMPGEDIPTFIAQPAPVMCQLERTRWLADQCISYPKHIANLHSQAS